MHIQEPNPVNTDSRGVAAADGTTQAKIERAALSLFAEHGIDGVSTKQIAASAGLSEGSIYRYFTGKDHLARSLMKTIHYRLTDMMSEARNLPNLDAQISHIVSEYCRIADADWVLFKYHILHMHRFSPLTDNPHDNPISVAAQIISKTEDTPEPKTLLLASMALGVVLNAAQAKAIGLITGPLSPHAPLFCDKVMAVISPQF